MPITSHRRRRRDGAFRSMSARDETRGNLVFPISTTSMPTEPRRRSVTNRTRRSGNGCSAMLLPSIMSSDQIVDRTFCWARRGGRTIFSILAISRQRRPPTINLEQPVGANCDRSRAADAAASEIQYRAGRIVRFGAPTRRDACTRVAKLSGAPWKSPPCRRIGCKS